jgi:isochorismate synthase EntC
MLSPSLDYETTIEKKLSLKKHKLLRLNNFIKNAEKESYKLSVKKLIKEINKGTLSKIVFF